MLTDVGFSYLMKISSLGQEWLVYGIWSVSSRSELDVYDEGHISTTYVMTFSEFQPIKVE